MTTAELLCTVRGEYETRLPAAGGRRSPGVGRHGRLAPREGVRRGRGRELPRGPGVDRWSRLRLGAGRHPAPGRRRLRGPGTLPQPTAGRDRDPDHGVRDGRDRHRGDPRRRVRSADQAADRRGTGTGHRPRSVPTPGHRRKRQAESSIGLALRHGKRRRPRPPHAEDRST